MKILFDENFPKSVADTVEACGYEVVPFDVIALRQPSRQAISTRLNWFFANFSAPFADKVFILRDFSCRLKLPRENPR